MKADNKYHPGVTLVISSTQERAIRTAAVAFGDLISWTSRGVALDSAREFLTSEPGERRTKISDRMRDPDFAVGWDFSNCTDDDELYLIIQENVSNLIFIVPHEDIRLRVKFGDVGLRQITSLVRKMM